MSELTKSLNEIIASVNQYRHDIKNHSKVPEDAAGMLDNHLVKAEKELQEAAALLKMGGF